MNKVFLSRNNDHRIQLFCLTAGTILAIFFWQGHLGFNLWDEGYLWYGAQRVLAGEVPIRDFSAYDPGRYYWSAAFMGMWGDNGIIALRASVAIFQGIGFFIAMMLLAQSPVKLNRLLWLLAMITLVVWMFPRHKLFDISLSISLIGALSFLLQQPTNRRYLLTGLFVGLVAVFGRNHGIYGVAGSLGVIAYLGLKLENVSGFVKALASWSLGVVIGYLPILLMVAVVPGFAQAFWDSIRFLFEIKATNLPLPVPWPWHVPFGQVPLLAALRGVLVGLFFVFILIFGVVSIIWVIRQRLQNKPVSSVLVASIFLALPYAHYAYSRADVGHLALSIFPFLIGSFVLLSSQPAKIKWSFAVLLCGASLWVMFPLHPGWQHYINHYFIEVDIAGDKLKVDPNTADDLAMLNKLSEKLAPGGRSIIVAPFWPGAYPALARKSPMWEIYALLPRGRTFEHEEIERIKAADPACALIIDNPLDGRDELRFSKTHPLTNQYIRENFELIKGYTQNPAYQIYRSKQAAL